jgi:hypothetical protein
MANRDARVDAYIAKAADFAKPILTHLRAVVHQGCPGVEEDLKWGMPAFHHKGILCMMGAFKQHCMFGFWKHALLAKRVKGLPNLGANAMNHFGRLTSIRELPDQKTLLRFVKEAALLNEQGIKPPKRKVTPVQNRVLQVPAYFMTALRRNKKALAAFEQGSYTFKKEYVVWIAGAKAEETRTRRLKTALQWMAQGKARNWKYEKC